MAIGMLRQDIRVTPPGEHGAYYLVFDPICEAYYKVEELTTKVMGLLWQEYESIDELYEVSQKGHLDVTKGELAELVMFLKQNSLLVPLPGEVEANYKKMKSAKDSKWFLRFASAYLFFKLPAYHPGPRFYKILGLFSFLFNKYVLYLLFGLACCGGLLIIKDISRISTIFIDSLSWGSLAKFFLAIVFMKIVHEGAHSLIANHLGCRVRAIGVGFMMFYPRLFTDTTDSWRLSRSKRLKIDGGGILGECIAGGIAALLWYYTTPGVLNSTLFYIFTVGIISTVFVNGNPFIRYDGYYILCDLLGIENLMTRSVNCCKNFFHYYGLRIGPPPAEKRRYVLLLFGVFAQIYRVFLYTSIIIIIYLKFIKVLAIVLLLVEIYVIFLNPIFMEWRSVKMLSKNEKKNHAVVLFWAIVLVCVGAVLALPWGWNVHLKGETVTQNRIPIIVQESGFLKSPWPKQGHKVEQGDTLFELQQPLTNFVIKRFVWALRRDELLLQLQELDQESYGDSLLTEEKIKSSNIGLSEFERRQKRLVHTASISGKFIPLLHELSENSFFVAGRQVGELIAGVNLVHAYATEHEITKLKIGQEVNLNYPDSLSEFSGKISGIEQIPVRLKSSPLLQIFGGAIPVYIDEKNHGEYRSIQSLYQIEITPEANIKLMSGRTINVEVLNKEILGKEFLRYIISIFRREF